MIFAFTVALAPNTDIAVCTRSQLAMATRGKVRRPALCSSRAPMPSDRQRKDECDQQMDEMVETVAPQAENARHQLLITR